MWFLAIVCASCLLVGTQGQGSANFWRGNDRSGRCQYSFTVASPTEASCATAGGGPDLEALKTRLGLLEVLVSRLAGEEKANGAGGQASLREAYTRAVGEKAQLQRQNEQLDRQVRELQQRVDELRQEVQRLQSRPCPQPPPASSPQQDSSVQPGTGPALSHLIGRTTGRGPGDTSSLRDPAWYHGGPGYQELKAEVTEVPAPKQEGTEDKTDDKDAHSHTSPGCGELVAISDPITHRKADSIAGKYGVWMLDPNATGTYGPDMVWRIDTVGSDVRQLFGYEDMNQLSRGYPTKVLLLPEAVESTGATLYRGSLYYQRRRSRTLIRYDLASESIAARRDLPHAGFHGQFPYSWGGYTDIDLAVDEQGLWAIYSTNKAKGAIVMSLLDHNSLEVKKSWETNIRKTSVANAFVICGRLYTVASYSSPNTTINYSYDTSTSQGKAFSVPFKNRYRYNSMVDYNPIQKKLFSWDNYHMVSYDLRLGRQ